MLGSGDGLTTDGSGVQVTGYSRDLDGRVAGIAYPLAFASATVNGQPVIAGASVTRVYDDAGRITSVNDGLGHISQFAYDADGNTIRETLPNGVVTAMSYDNADRVARSTSVGPDGTFLDLPYTRDAIGQVATANPLGTSPGVTQAFGYDPANHLLSASLPAGPASVPNQSYTYDPADHLTSITTGLLTKTCVCRPLFAGAGRSARRSPKSRLTTV